MNILLYGPEPAPITLPRALADMFGLSAVLDSQHALFKLADAEPCLVVREATTSAAYDMAAAYGFRTVIHVDDASRLLQHAYSAPPLAGLDVVDGTGILKGNADLSPEEQRALDAAQVNLRG